MVHSGDPFGEKKSQLIFSPNGPPSCFYPNRSSHILNPQLLLILEPAEGSEFTERISVLSGLKTESTQKNTKHILCHSMPTNLLGYKEKSSYPSRGSHSAERIAIKNLENKKLHPSIWRNRAQSTYRPVIDYLLNGEGHPESCQVAYRSAVILSRMKHRVEDGGQIANFELRIADLKKAGRGREI